MADTKLTIAYLRYQLRLLCCFGVADEDLVAPMGTDPECPGKLQKYYDKNGIIAPPPPTLKGKRD